MKKERRSMLIKKKIRLSRNAPKVRKMVLHRSRLLQKQLEMKCSRMKKIR